MPPKSGSCYLGFPKYRSASLKRQVWLLAYHGERDVLKASNFVVLHRRIVFRRAIAEEDADAFPGDGAQGDLEFVISFLCRADFEIGHVVIRDKESLHRFVELRVACAIGLRPVKFHRLADEKRVPAHRFEVIHVVRIDWFAKTPKGY